MANQFQIAGGQDFKPVRFAPIWTNRFFSGLYTQRNPLRSAGSAYEERWIGMRTDAMISGSNVEISNRLTPVRRPGHSVYNSATFASVDYFYEFRLFSTTSEQIKVMVDTATTLYDGTGPSTQTTVWTKSTGAGQTFMQYVANILYFGNGVDQKKWIQTLATWQALTAYTINPTVGQLTTFIIDTNGNIEQLIAFAITTITNVAITSNVLTLTVGSNTNLTIGQKVVLWGLTTATFLNGQTVTIASKPAGQITAAFTHADYVSAVDTGAVAQQQGGSPVTGTVQPTWNVSSTAPNNATIDASAVWVNRGTPVRNWGIVGPTTTPTVTPGASNNSWQASAFYSNDGQAIIDSNGNLQKVTTTGTSGSVTPTWSTSVGSTTADGTVVWTMTQTAASLVWQAHTQYGPATITAFSITTNVVTITCANNFKVGQTVVPSGLTTGTYLNGVFLLVASASSTQFTANFTHANVGATNDSGTATPGAFIIGSASGTNSLFEINVTTPSIASITGAITAFGWNSTTNGAFNKFFPAPATDFTINNVPSLSWHGNTGQNTQMDIINGAGEVTGQTDTGHYENWEAAIVATIHIPVAGNYAFNLSHDDGAIYGFGAGPATPQKISGTLTDGFNHTQTAQQGYPVMAGNNNSSSFPVDPLIINFPVAGDYPLEIDWTNWQHASRMILTCNGQTITPGPSESGTTQPIWPVFSTTFAPAYATVKESAGQYVWSNLGPTTDFVWPAKTIFPPVTTIVDSNGNSETAFRTGVTGTTIPTWKTNIYGLTSDNPNLIWINLGPAAAPTPGTLSTFNGGWSYAVSLVNTLTNTVSNAGITTVATGNFRGSAGVTVSGGLPASPDPQADYVAIFRTKDGGANWFLITGPGNTIYTVTLAQYQASGFVDTTLDANLNILLQAPLASQNTPPPSGFINLTYHLNRIFGSVGNTVYWSAGPDTPIGNGVEGFPPSNNAVFPSAVTRLVPTSIGALVYTVSDIYVLGGQGTSFSPIFPQPYATGIGLLSYNALAVNGTISYLFTADRQVVALDPTSGVSQVGFPIGDQFRNFDPASTYVTWHVDGSDDQALYVSNGSTGWFRMTQTSSPESGLTWSPFATISGGAKAVQSIEVSPGTHRLLVGPITSGPVLQRSLSVFDDNGTKYLANFTLGSIVLAQPGQVAEIAFITTDAKAVGSQPVLGILIDEISGVFDGLNFSVPDPPQLSPSLTTYAQRFYLSQTKKPALCRHIQIQVNWPAESAQNELLSATIFGGYLQES